MAECILARCSLCGVDKPSSEYIKTTRRCRDCRVQKSKDFYALNKEVLKVRMKKWRDANRDYKNAKDREYRANNKERCYEKTSAWRMANPERSNAAKLAARHRDLETYRAREAAYRAANRAACNERISEWKKKNPHATVAYFHKRRAAQLRAIPAWADLDAIAAVFARAQAMGAGYHVDHTVPLLSKFVCGLHCEANLQVIPAEENMRKNNRRWPDMWETL